MSNMVTIERNKNATFCHKHGVICQNEYTKTCFKCAVHVGKVNFPILYKEWKEMTKNFKMVFPDMNFVFYPTISSIDTICQNHPVGYYFIIPKDAKMKNLKE